MIRNRCEGALQGIGSRLSQHSLQAARRLGFRLGALQSPVVITSNAYTD